HDYTRDTIARFKQAGVLPDMVQIGNENQRRHSVAGREKLGAGRRRVHDYTRDTIARFKQAGVLPDMVQIGNENQRRHS
ncbi:hypothetical protein C7D73_30545, partial [Klebsiella pneumoniae]